MKLSHTIYKIVLLLLTAIIIIGGYLLLRYEYKITDEMPFAQEVVLIVMGTLMTVLITALLLNKQTEVELKKEQSVRYMELKSQLYLSIIDDIEKVLGKAELSQMDLLHLEFFSHRLAIAASPSVLEEYGRFVSEISSTVSDMTLNSIESDIISRALARLTIHIREDLIGQNDRENHIDPDQLNSRILSNANQAIVKFNYTTSQ
ncbi:hypothetical protein [methanotrophic endosymbiont of Bathymodiolus puteoserpentis (Logatchev)]|jgi:hypothetical protein|uniref:hypothetical protein n=1 Tax=methanotrophic endosymbiont of Bathymodiolus puteoserpentis (Logatchev) TaxID=343235 RepID=UPI0013C8948E|nr:hypothetical protein [methanotrophic endosymbiont of Bathymodiolus puteoserpentis (Logatchev)]SHE21085.1 hypothetical protein BPUTEOMOX_2590 [methanotrophic endosymbiont of Bathymodiolus puteoserpentis (Logatchev)]